MALPQGLYKVRKGQGPTAPIRLHNGLGEGLQTNPPKARDKISFYLFNPVGGLGVGSYVQDPIVMKEWRHIVGVADATTTKMYSNGQEKDCDSYQGPGTDECPPFIPDGVQVVIVPTAGAAMLRIGTRDLASHFLGAIARVRIWRRALTGGEIRVLYESDTMPRGSDLVAEFLLNEGSGAVATDSSGNANHGTIYDGAWGTA